MPQYYTQEFLTLKTHELYFIQNAINLVVQGRNAGYLLKIINPWQNVAVLAIF